VGRSWNDPATLLPENTQQAIQNAAGAI
jgi:hypothetical protein